MSDFIIENGVLVKYTGNGGDVVIPDGVTDIGYEAFRKCKNLILAYYRKTKDTKALINEFEKIVTYVIQQNDIAVIESLIAVDNLFTKKNIDKLIQTAIDNQKHEIYVILLNYKAEKLGFKDIKEQFKL